MRAVASLCLLSSHNYHNLEFCKSINLYCYFLIKLFYYQSIFNVVWLIFWEKRCFLPWILIVYWYVISYKFNIVWIEQEMKWKVYPTSQLQLHKRKRNWKLNPWNNSKKKKPYCTSESEPHKWSRSEKTKHLQDFYYVVKCVCIYMIINLSLIGLCRLFTSNENITCFCGPDFVLYKKEEN